MYHSQLGRFGSRDPVGYRAGDQNLHRYVENRPIVSRDPNGLGCLIYYQCQRLYEIDDGKFARSCYYLCVDVQRVTSVTGTYNCDDEPLASIPIGSLKHIHVKRRSKCFQCKDTEKKRDPYDFTPDDNLFPSVDYEQCMNACSMPDPVKVLCEGLSGPIFTVCKAMVGAGMEVCKNYCEIFQK